MVTAERIFTPTELAILHRMNLAYTAREYTRRVDLREQRRAWVHEQLGFTNAPYQPRKGAHRPNRTKPAEQVGRGARKPVAWAPSKPTRSRVA